MPTYYTRLKNADGPLPIVIVVQEIFGVHEHIHDLCRCLAQEGYLAVTPELCFCQGDPDEYHDVPTLSKEPVIKASDTQVLADLDHVTSWAARHDGDAHRLLITGFCRGGRTTWLHVVHSPQLEAGVTWYGKLVEERSLSPPKHPVDIAVDLNAPVPGLYGAKDTGVLQDTIETMRQALRTVNVTAGIVVYPEADHASSAGYRASYHEESTKDGWQRILVWFAQYGGKKAQSPNA